MSRGRASNMGTSGPYPTRLRRPPQGPSLPPMTLRAGREVNCATTCERFHKRKLSPAGHSFFKSRLGDAMFTPLSCLFCISAVAAPLEKGIPQHLRGKPTVLYLKVDGKDVEAPKELVDLARGY